MSVEIYDHELIAIDKGPVAWMASKQGSRMPLEEFVRTAEGKFTELGFRARVKAFETTEDGTYAFEVEIEGRVEDHAFDFDRQVHEVTRNILDEPGVERGFINTAKAMAEFRANNPDAHKGHGPGCVT
jgi:hypothetical protein